MNKHKFFIRIIVSPIILALIVVTYLFLAIKNWLLFLRYGGEWITFQENERPNIEDIYRLLKDKK